MAQAVLGRMGLHRSPVQQVLAALHPMDPHLLALRAAAEQLPMVLPPQALAVRVVRAPTALHRSPARLVRAARHPTALLALALAVQAVQVLTALHRSLVQQALAALHPTVRQPTQAQPVPVAAPLMDPQAAQQVQVVQHPMGLHPALGPAAQAALRPTALLPTRVQLGPVVVLPTALHPIPARVVQAAQLPAAHPLPPALAAIAALQLQVTELRLARQALLAQRREQHPAPAQAAQAELQLAALPMPTELVALAAMPGVRPLQPQPAAMAEAPAMAAPAMAVLPPAHPMAVQRLVTAQWVLSAGTEVQVTVVRAAQVVQAKEVWAAMPPAVRLSPRRPAAMVRWAAQAAAHMEEVPAATVFPITSATVFPMLQGYPL